MLDRAGIERCLPHGPPMCLLDAVTHWDETRITCIAAAPGEDHALAVAGVVPAVAAIEYAAQATAVHGAMLQAGHSRRAGVLAKLTGVDLHTDRFPAQGDALTVHVERLGHGDAACLYRFDVSSGQRPIASGRLMVAFAAGSLP